MATLIQLILVVLGSVLGGLAILLQAPWVGSAAGVCVFILGVWIGVEAGPRMRRNLRAWRRAHSAPQQIRSLRTLFAILATLAATLLVGFVSLTRH